MKRSELEQFARIGARQHYAELHQQLANIAAAFPDLVEDFHEIDGTTPVRRAKRSKHAAPTTDALTQVLLKHMPLKEKLSPPVLRQLVKDNGYTFPRSVKHPEKLLSAALANLMALKVVARTGHARGTRYELLKAS